MSKVVLPPPPPKPSTKKDLWFEIPTAINLGEQPVIIEDGPGLIEEDSNEFGLTRGDYAFLLWDIENEIARFDEEHGFDGFGYREPDGSYIRLYNDKTKELDEKRKNLIRKRRFSK